MTVTLPTLAELNPDDLYDLIMAQIEPDLLSSQVGKLEAKYATELPEAKAKRMQRYKAAWEQYTQERDAYFARCKVDLVDQRAHKLEAAEAASRSKEEGQLTLLEDFFNS